MSQAEQSSGSSAPAHSYPKLTRRRLWIFRLLMLLMVPLAFGALELALRLFDYGHETSFFLRQTRDGREYLVENPHFGFRFFPPSMARSPTPIVIPAKKAPGTTRIFVFGESAALGDPKPAFGIGRYLEVLLNNRFPSRNFEVVCVAMTAINSHVVLPIARECARHDGDLWIIYMGNNEMIGPFGGANDADSIPGINFIRASLLVKETRLGQLIEATIRKFRPGPQTWRGLAQWAELRVPADAPVRAKVDEHFRRNLRDILRAARSCGAKALLSDVGANLRDWSPHASLHNPSVSPPQIEQWKLHFISGLAAAASNRLAEAIFSFDRAVAIDPGFAETYFRTALCQSQLNNTPAARRDFQKALDCDALPVRTTSARNQIIRDTAKEFPNAQFFSLTEALSQTSSNGIPGSEMFIDHVHFTFAGAYTAARALADQVEKSLSLSPPPSPWLPQNDCEAQLGISPWNRYLAVENILTRLTDSLYTNQTTNLKTRRDLRSQLTELRRLARADQQSDANFKNLLAKDPDDFYAQQNYAEFLELNGDLPSAVQKWQTVARLLPHHPVAYYQCGRLDLKLGNFDEAEKDLTQALRIRPDFHEACVELGQVFRKQGKKSEAISTLEKAVAQNPSNPAARFHLADALAFAGQKKEALIHLQAAIALRPVYWEARYFLGVEQAIDGDLPGAEKQFRAVVQLRPDFPLGHFNLAVALARQKKFAEAEKSFLKTLQLDPNHAGARQQLEAVRAYLSSSVEQKP